MTISKSSFLKGELCTRGMWLHQHRPELVSVSEGGRRLIDQGVQVGEVFRGLFPDGNLLYNYGESVDAAKTVSLEEVVSGESALFEAVFEHEGVLVVTDVLVPNSDGSWKLIEVKSSGSVKDEHVLDLAIQKWVLDGNGIALSSTELAHINNKYEGGDVRDLYTIVDLSQQVNLKLEIDRKAQEFIEILESDEQPDVPLGKHCKSCTFEEYCFGEDVGKSIFSIPRISDKKVAELQERGIFRIIDVPEDVEFTATQQAIIDVQVHRSISIDKKSIRAALQAVAFPIYFLDFETVNPAIPLVAGIKPFTQVPFQYSCHQLDEDGTLSHFEYLHEKPGDPRRDITESLVQYIGVTGTVVVYNAGFERGVLTKLAEEFEDLRDLIENITERLWDLLPIMRRHYNHYGMGNSYSIKSVLPVVAPDLAYGDLDVQEGSQAGAVWLTMIECDDAAEKESMSSSLKEYCNLDTQAMVEIYLHLNAL